MNSETRPSILLVEDDDKFRKTLELEFWDRGYIVHSISKLQEFDTLNLSFLKFVAVDLRLGAESGLHGLEIIKAKFPNCRVVIITGYGTIATAVAAMKQGASSYVTKPFDISTLEQHLWYDQSPYELTLPEPGRESLDRHEREYIEYVLTQCNGCVSKAARWLNIHRQSLQRKLRKYPSKR